MTALRRLEPSGERKYRSLIVGLANGEFHRSTRSRVGLGRDGVRLKAAVGATGMMRQEQPFADGLRMGRNEPPRSISPSLN
jgi:hypothetical protein